MRTKERNNLQRIAVVGIFSALSIILGKLFAFNIGELFRVSLENLPIIFIGIALGPIFGAVVGAVADLVGCLMVGYTINPVITLGAVAIGGISGIISRLTKNISTGKRVFLSVLSAHIFGSVIIKSIGLSWFYGTDFWTLIPYRALNYVLIIALEYTIIYILMKNKGILSSVRSLGE